MIDRCVHRRNSKLANQLLRYGIVGLLSNFGGYLVYILITQLGLEPKLAMSILYTIGASLGFIGNRKWTFVHDGHWLGAGGRYLLAHFIGYFINLTLLIMFVDVLGYAHQWVQAIAIFIVAGYLFLMFKFYVFVESIPEVREGK